MGTKYRNADPRTLLRDVLLGDSGYRLITWETDRRQDRGGYYLGYILKTIPGGAVVFSGDDYAPPPSTAIDSDEALRTLMSFLTLQPGDTDDDYFRDYDKRQMAWCRSNEPERLSDWSGEDSDGEFVDVD